VLFNQVRTHSKPVSMSVGLGAPRGGRARHTSIFDYSQKAMKILWRMLIEDWLWVPYSIRGRFG
jgi:hypothetical protein